MKYKIPNHTQVPNDFIDKDMRKLNGSETKVFLVICRKTIGWHKESDYISISQIMEKAGISNRVVIKSAKSLHKMGFITRQSTKHTTMYTINFDSQDDEKSQIEDVHRVTKGHRDSDERSQVEVKTYDYKSHTKESSKETNTKERPVSIYDKNNPLSLATIYLYDQIMKHINPPTYQNKKPNLDTWYIDIDRLHRIDGVSIDNIRKVIDYAVVDNFWKSNILSASKLRKHFDRLYIAMQSNTQGQPEKKIYGAM